MVNGGNGNEGSNDINSKLDDLRDMLEVEPPTPEGPIPEEITSGVEPNIEHDLDSNPEMPIKSTSDLPDYLGDEPPKTTMGYIKWALCNGATNEDLIKEGQNATSVRIAALQLEKAGHRLRPPRKQPGREMAPVDEANFDGARPGTETSLIRTVTEKRNVRVGSQQQIKAFARGSPAELIVESMKMPEGIAGMDQFLTGIKFGANLVIAGVRIGQELSQTGVTMVKPIIEAAKDMRAGEAVAADNAAANAAGEAASQAANQVMGEVAPYISKLKELLEEKEANQTPIEETNEMKKMMLDTMKPMMKQITNKLTQRLTGVDPSKDDNAVPDGWTKE